MFACCLISSWAVLIGEGFGRFSSERTSEVFYGNYR